MLLYVFFLCFFDKKPSNDRFYIKYFLFCVEIIMKNKQIILLSLFSINAVAFAEEPTFYSFISPTTNSYLIHVKNDENNNGDNEDPIPTQQSAKLIASDGAIDDKFGSVIDISGNKAIITATHDDDKGVDSGSAYIFSYDGSNWIQEAKLLASDGAARDSFGISASISNNVAVVGSYYDDDKGSQSGSVYVFRFNGASWIQEAKLLANDGTENDYFGYSVSISEDKIIVGSFSNSEKGTGAGAAYAFRYNGSSWIQEAKLFANDAAQNDYFGYSVSISGDKAIIGSLYDDVNVSNSGSAYIFEYRSDNWTQAYKISADDGALSDIFGESVSIHNDTVIVSARGVNDQGTNSGAAYIFNYDGIRWSQEAKLLANDGSAADHFGRKVSIYNNTAILSSTGNDEKANAAGAAYIFANNGGTWEQKSKLLANDGEENDSLGTSVSIFGDKALVGTIKDDDKAENAGAVYVFTP